MKDSTARIGSGFFTNDSALLQTRLAVAYCQWYGLFNLPLQFLCYHINYGEYVILGLVISFGAGANVPRTVDIFHEACSKFVDHSGRFQEHKCYFVDSDGEHGIGT